MTEKVIVEVDSSKSAGKLAHTWNYIGYDECNYTHSPGGEELIAKFGNLEKPYYMRAHHMLCTGNLHGFYKWGSTNVYIEDENGTPTYNFDLIDEMCDIWLLNDCKPFFEIGFMPRDLADPRKAENGEFYQIAYGISEYQRIGWAMPPKDYQKWYDLIHALVSHCVERYGKTEIESWYFEMWNEPDIFYWHGTCDEFCKLYDYTEAAIHDVLPTARFGGPATCGTRSLDTNASVFLRKFLEHVKSGKNYCTGNVGTRIDFTSFHTKGGGYRFDMLAQKQLPSVKVFLENVKTEFSIIKELGFDNLECVLSEADPDGWAAGGRFDNFNLNFRNTEYYASYTASAYKNLYDLAESLNADIRPLAWAFMFEGERCFEGTRTFSTQGIDKAMMNLFKFYSMMGENRVSLKSGRDLDPLTYKDDFGTAEGSEIDGWATASDDSVEVLLYCHHDDWDIGDEFEIEFSALMPFEGKARLRHYRIDETHSNAYAEWERQGCPNYPDAEQYVAIKQRDSLEFCEAPQMKLVNEGKLTHRFKLPTHGISLLIIDKA